MKIVPAICLLHFSPLLGVQAAPPPLREEISLNGAWEKGGGVPNYFGVTIGAAPMLYERTVTVPPEWKGQRVVLEFQAVNWSVVVSVNGAPAGSHVGGWVPFAMDITDRVVPGRAFTLTLAVSGMNVEPTSLPAHPRAKRVCCNGRSATTSSMGAAVGSWMMCGCGRRAK